MPLVTRTAVSGNHYSQAAAPANPLAGDVWTDTDADLTYRRNDANSDWALIATHPDVSNAEYSYLDGVTSAIQTQINTKAATASPTFTGTVTIPTLDITGGQTHKLLTKCFEEFATGDSLSVLWTQTDHTGTGAFSMLDGLGGGMKIATAGSIATELSSFNFNNIRHFDPANCTIYGIIKAAATTQCLVLCGLSSGIATPLSNPNHFLVFGVDTGNNATYFGLIVGNGTGAFAATDVALSTNATPFKFVCTASNVKLYLLVGGVWTLKITQTANKPTTVGQPVFIVGTESTVTAVKSGVLMYFRVENDS